MALTVTEASIAAAVRDAGESGARLEIQGAGTLLARLSAPDQGERRTLSVAGYSGVVAYEPDDLTITVRAGTPVAELTAAIEESGQECPIEGPGSTVGGRIASGLSGIRTLGAGHLREWLLGGRVVTARGDAIRFGAPTVKNVTGYDLARLICGSWGTLAVLTEVTLRVRPRPAFSGWFTSEDPAFSPGSLYRPASVLKDRGRHHVLLEGHPRDCLEQARGAGLDRSGRPPLPGGARIAVPPERIDELVARIDGPYAAEVGVGIVHADPPADSLRSLRARAESLGGRMLVLDPRGGVPDFGSPGEASALDARVKASLDPDALFPIRGFLA